MSLQQGYCRKDKLATSEVTSNPKFYNSIITDQNFNALYKNAIAVYTMMLMAVNTTAMSE